VSLSLWESSRATNWPPYQREEQPWLRDRLVLVRSGAEGWEFRLSRQQQILALGLTLALTLWAVTASFLVAANWMKIAQQDAEIIALNQSTIAATDELTKIEELVGGIAHEIETGQSNLMALSQHQGDHGPEVAHIAPIADGSATLHQRSAELSDLLAKLRRQNQDFVRRSGDVADSRIHEVEQMLAGMGLSSARLISTPRASSAPPSTSEQAPDQEATPATRGPLKGPAKGKADAYGAGGPFVPLTLAGADGMGLESPDFTLAAIHSNYSRLDQLNEAVRHIPLRAPLDDYEVTSGFGARNDPINILSGFHEGVDLGAPYGTTIHATGKGKVSFAGWKDRYGMTIDIDHGSGLLTRYAHMSRLLVRLGQGVESGTPIGEIGTTGRTTGPHLHYEVRIDERPHDPLKFIAAGSHVLTQQ